MGFTPEQIKGRIKSVAKQNNADARTLMRIYMMERFLERLAQSEYRDNFIIKGGILVTAMIGVAHTRCLKEFPFPEYRNEKFLGEDLVWIRMAMKYQMVHINRAIYVGNYLEDGLTKNRRKNNIRSPYGCMERAKEFMRPELKLKYRLKGAVQYLVYGKFAGEKQLIAKAPYKGLAVCVALPSMLVYHRWSKSV